MTTYKNFIPTLLLCLMAGAAAPAVAQTSASGLTMDEAVLKVQQETGGTLLSAESHSVGHGLKYFIKVLTPDGHVRKFVISSGAAKSAAPSQSTKNPPAKRAGSKEKH